ncbi:MAG: stage 0 sporulation family protein [Anaerolineae bacterium]|nr:stage 0 sporulation family protein [Anaerolineae bacterium]
MPEVVGVRFRQAGKIYYFAPTGFEDLKVGDYVVVDTARGEDVGRVAVAPRRVADGEVVGQLKGILRRAEPWDLLQMQNFRDREEQALEKCRQKITEYGLPMKVIKAEYNFDGTRLVFYFTAEKRVDFRKLVKELAKTFRSRIELKQVGVRDEAKLIGDLGRCGRPLCCASHLCEFNPVSIKMAKQQDLPLSPMEISGICGRLLCCLAYENDYYAEVKKELPKVGDVVVTPHGSGKVTGINVLKETLSVELDSEATIEITAEELETDREPTSRRPRGRRRRR